MKNICLIIGSLGGGGAERVVLSLAAILSDAGHNVEVIVLSNTVYYDISKVNFQVHIIEKQKHPLRFIKFISKLKRAQDLHKKIAELNVKFDLFISNSSSANKICRQAKLPNLYFCIHSTISARLESRYQNSKGLVKLSRRLKYSILIKKFYKNQNLITVSNGVEEDLLNFGIKPKSVQTIYNPFDFNHIQQQAGGHKVEEQDYIIHVGRFHKSKRHDILIKAYAKSKIKQKLLLLGDYKNAKGKEAQMLVAKLDLQNQVIFKGFNPNPYPYIKNAKALILSSDFEGLAMVLIEALVLGVPVVSTDCLSGPNEILINELAPFLSPVGDIDALSTNIKKMMDNPVKITDKYFARFSAEVCAKKYLALC